jgi:anti-sigma regulatory factor (Ser/Thr protein kinase)
VEVIAQQRIAMQEATQVGEARRVAASLASAVELPETEAGRVAIVVNELGSNLTRHAKGGELFLRELRAGNRRGVEVLSIDRGPGMDVNASMRDGHSTAGTRGEGLGAVSRLAQEFDAYSTPAGTVVMARVWTGGALDGQVQIGAVCQPFPGERECGDGWSFSGSRSRLRLLVVDGLGHGPVAARAANAAVETFGDTDRLAGPEAIVHTLHGALRPTRGAALAVAEVDLISRVVRFAGVGNIGATIETPPARARGLLSHNGSAGHEARRIQEFQLPWPAHGALIVHSDGLTTHWKLEAYPGLLARHAAVIAGVLFRDFRRNTDDATVVVLKEP